MKFLEAPDCADVAVEFGRGLVSTDAEKDPRIFPGHTCLKSNSTARDKYSSTGFLPECWNFWSFLENS